MAISAAGIGSNLDVQGLVTQLMALERRPVDRLQSRISSFNASISQYGRVRSELSALQSAAQGLGSSTAFNTFSATLSEASAGAATASTDASAGAYAIRVQSLARAQTLVSPNTSNGTLITDADTTISGTATLTITQAGSSFALSLADQSLTGIRDAINDASDNTGVVASVISDGSGARLVLRSEETGAANAVTAIAVSGASNANYDFLEFTAGTAYSDTATTTGQSVAGTDAQITVDGVTVSSSTNVFSQAIQGVTFVAKAETASAFTLTVARDDTALVDKAKAFVTAYNIFMQNSTQRYAKGGALASDSMQLSIMNSLRSAVGAQGGSADNSLRYLVEIGISVDKDGVMSLNADTLRSALTDDAAAVINLLADSTDGIFERLDTLVTAYLEFDGLIDSRESGLRSSITSLEERIEQMERRLESVETRLRREFSNLDALLGRLSQTSASLSRTLG